LLVFNEDPAVDTKDESRGVELAIIVVFWIGVFWREWFSLILGAELKFDVIFGRVPFERLHSENVLIALDLASPFPFYPFHSITI
jgi:hypothetical protein